MFPDLLCNTYWSSFNVSGTVCIMYVLFCSFDSSDRKSKSWREVETATDENSAEEIESDEQGNVSRYVCNICTCVTC